MSGVRREIIKEKSVELSLALEIDFIDKEFNYGKGSGRADNYFQKKDRLIILEVEKSQRHPEMNVLKVWPYLKRETSKSIFLIQYIVDIKSVSPNRLSLCKWLGNEMMENLGGRFNYFLIENQMLDNINLKKKIELYLK